MTLNRLFVLLMGGTLPSLAAEGAGEGLLLGVHLHVAQQAAPVQEALAALSAGVRPLLAVDALVRGERRAAREALAAVAGVRPLLRVRAQVALQVGGAAEAQGAAGAAVGARRRRLLVLALLSVLAALALLAVSHQRRLPGEGAAAAGAQVLSVLHVGAAVLPLSRRRLEELSADRALVAAPPAVRVPVPLQRLLEGEAAAALGAQEGLLARVDAAVSVQQRLEPEALEAVGAAEAALVPRGGRGLVTQGGLGGRGLGSSRTVWNNRESVDGHDHLDLHGRSALASTGADLRWENHLRGDGAFRDGAFRDGAFRDGAFRDGAFRDGAFGDGAFGDGAFGDGAFGGGAFRDGAFGDGAFRLPSLKLCIHMVLLAAGFLLAVSLQARVDAALLVRAAVLHAGRRRAVLAPGAVRAAVPVERLPEGEAAVAVAAAVRPLPGVDDPVRRERRGELELLVAVRAVVRSRRRFPPGGRRVVLADFWADAVGRAARSSTPRHLFGKRRRRRLVGLGVGAGSSDAARNALRSAGAETERTTSSRAERSAPSHETVCRKQKTSRETSQLQKQDKDESDASHYNNL
ncbi:hypothetical protein EYF80_035600 [Liparis tanakae]|uniref:Uncharacterized protein n=1 Tax=Liparis tanakae TaxID=230148 RepID=A0A4Z2GND3_9TELE|nr:hypothetical protein EYF80_035600 [Liparis tanakae]